MARAINTCQFPMSKAGMISIHCATRTNPQLRAATDTDMALLYDREKEKGNANRGTLAVTRKLVAYLMAVDRGQTHFLVIDREACVAA